MAYTDKLLKMGTGTLTSLAAPGKAIAASSLNITDATNWPTDTGVVFAIRKISPSLVTPDNPSGTIPGTYTEWRAQLSSTTLSNLTLVYGDDQVYSEGASTQVYIPLSSYAWNRMIDALLISLKQDGTLKDTAIVSALNNGQSVPTGTVFDFAGATLPTGYLWTDGSAVSRSTYSGLFDAIGTVYGVGNGTTTFNLPDKRQKFSLAKAASGTGNTLGATGGAIDHTHPLSDNGYSKIYVSSGNIWERRISASWTGGNQVGDISNDTNSTFSGSLGSPLGGTTDAANPPYIVFNNIIKT